MEELDWEVLKNCQRIKGNEDRVRICDTKSVTSESVYSKASSQKSGWRQKSYSSIDLSTNSDHQPGAGAFRYRDFETQDDSCIKNSKNNKNKETQRDYEDIYNINPKAQGLKGEIIKEHNKINHDKRDNEVCSLRRTKSLAVIREETFNDLNIAAPTTRRSQLIPRAKLIDRHFFKDRLSFTLDEGLSFSLDSNLTSESTKNSGSNNNSNFFSWNCDKSDLGSIDSNFFKNSLHQSALLAEKSSTLQTESTSISTVTSKIVSRAEIHNENICSSNNNNNDSGNSSNSGTTRLNSKKSENNNEIESTVNINEDTESGITIIEIKDRKQLSKPTSSVISYDSIYLSSESDKQTVLGDTISNLEDIDSKIKDFEKIIRELNLIGDNEKSDSIIDNLYSQVAKGGVISTTELDLPTIFNQPKINLDASSADYISKGTLERLKFLSGLTLNGSTVTYEKDLKKNEKNKASRDNKGFQYSSLPDVDISKLLRDCELIDANLRDDVSIELLEPYPDYDLNSAENNIPSPSPSPDTIDRNKTNIQKDTNSSTHSKSEISVNLNEPISLEEENPKGAPSIELVLLSTKELNGKIKENTIDGKTKAVENATKIYLPDLGLELDYENSIASFEEEGSEEDYIAVVPQKVIHHNYQPPTYNLVTISGRKVIVDELAAKTEQQKENYNNRGEATSKEKKHIETTANANKRKEGKSNSSASPSLSSANISSNKAARKAIAGKINGVDNQQTNIDKKAARKIKLPEHKQSFADSIIDKEILFRKKSNLREVEEVAFQLTDEKGASNVINDKKDFTSFCILQQKNTGGVNSSSNSNMPRPQLLNVIDSKNSAPKQNQQPQQKQRSNKVPDVRIVMTTDVEEKPLPLNEAEKEFLHKVDSVRNYWSKILDSDGSKFKTLSKAFSTSKSSSDIPSSLRNEDFQSFFPTVEIVELNGETQAALVTARKLNDEEFDHVRYKVMKSEMFQKNLERNNGNRKETQFDGLMQYLQDYSFQELLASNNVVIIEPVRTKIEKVSEKPNQAQSGPCKITNGAALLNRSGSNNLKKHFFYHPIRVNKELYEDELPVPDTVRNVRKLFEESLRISCGKKYSENYKNSKASDNMKQRKTIRYLTIDTSFDNNLATSKWDSISLSSGVSSAADLSSPCECHESANRNVSNSSSNGSKENLDNNNEENVVDEKSHFVGSDVLEKLRECGSSITYNGGNGSERKSVLSHDNEKHNSELMTKAIVKEGQKCNCQGRQARGFNGDCGAEKVATTKKINGSDYTGLKFKLVKSNSCSSRLELAGTGLEKNFGILNVVDEMRNIVHGQRRQLHEEQEDERENENDVKLGVNLEHEETVKDMIYKLETKNFTAPTKPRIIESRCIEKVHPTSSSASSTTTTTTTMKEPSKVTINNQASSFIAPSMLSNIDPKNDYEEYVTVNNHISISSKTSELNNPTILMMNENGGSNISSNSSSCENVSKIQSSSTTTKPKVVRNKNVDLALLAAVNKKKEIEKNPKGFNSREIENIFAQNDNHNEHENSNAFIKTSRNDICKMQSVDMVKHQDKKNSSNHTKSHQQQHQYSLTSDAHFVASSEKIVASSSSNKVEEKPVKMVNWGTVGVFCKEFVANDNRLVHQQVKIYDDMEFEEFEVAGEHYDSLNSK